MVGINEVLSDNSLYFSEMVDFLDQFSWMFAFPNTDILVLDILSQIPHNWITAFSCMTDEQLAQYPEQLCADVRELLLLFNL